MVTEILTAVGIPFKESHFLVPPDGTYAVWLDNVTNRGADDVILIREHSYTIEVYSAKIDPVSEASLESALDSRAIAYDKSEHIWIQSENLFETVYTFDHIEKRR